MKKYKLYLTFIILVFVSAFFIMKSLDKESYAINSDTSIVGTIPEGTRFEFSAKNIYTHYHITNNFNTAASGTKILNAKNDNETKVVVYCAEQGKTLGSGKIRKRYHITSTISNWKSETVRDKLNRMMPYAYPYITLTELKNYLKGDTIGLGETVYNEYGFDSLNVQETITAVQAAIWNIEKNTTKYKFDKYRKYDNDGSLKSFRTCQSYYKGKILTSEEEAWYNADGCSKDGEFYKNVYSLNSESTAKRRVNKLIEWYTTTLLSKVTDSSSDIMFTIKSSSFDNINGKLAVEFETNLADYQVIFKDQNENELLNASKTTDNKFEVPITTNVKEVKISVTSSSASKSVYIYIGKGQDFIGVDNSSFSKTFSLLNEGSGKVIIYKVTGSDKNVEVNYAANDVDNSICGTGCLEEAVFGLYADDKVNLIKNYTTSTTPLVIDNLPAGTYYLREEKIPIGYVSYDYNQTNVDENGFIKLVIDNGTVASVTVNNDKTPKICFAKVDENDNTKILDGANFWIEDIDGTLYLDFVTSSQENTYCIDEGNLQDSTYLLYENQAPEGYIKSEQKYKFVVGQDEDFEIEDAITITPVNNVYTIVNKKGLTKTDMATGNCLAGAKLVITDSNNQKVDEWTSTCEDGQDIHEVDLPAGSYTLTEISTPTGYATAESIEFTVDENGKINKSLNMQDSPLEVCIQKVVKGTNQPLEGVEFEIYTEDGTLYDKITTSKDLTSNCLRYIPVGKYTLKEIKTPEGYQSLTETMTFEVKDTNETQIVKVENEVIVPITSINASQVIALIASVFTLFGLGTVGYYVYKKQI